MGKGKKYSLSNDISGNSIIGGYDIPFIEIGEQVWMIQNLSVEKFRNGDTIREVSSKQEWLKSGEQNEPAFCYYKNLQSNGRQYGKLYNWYAVNDPRGLAPQGWKIPSQKDWEILVENLGELNSYKNLPDFGTINYGANFKKNRVLDLLSIFGGGRSSKYDFVYFDSIGFWWSSTEISKDVAGLIFHNKNENLIDPSAFSRKNEGFSVKCLAQ